MRTVAIRALVPVFLCFAANVTAAESATWRAGVARRNITPDAPLWMTGYAVRDHPAEGRAQDLWVKALALEDAAGHRGVVITADLCGVTRAMTDRVADELQRRGSLPRQAVMFNASHTHCAPAIAGWLGGLRVAAAEEEDATARYTRHVIDQMVAVATAALGEMKPATLSANADTATFAINRRNNPEKEAPARRAAGTLRGPVDHAVPVLAVRATDGRLLALLVSYACHNTTLSFYQWHGDYAGCAQAEIERRHPGATALFVQGCGGNINPSPRGTVELAEQHGRELADAVDRALHAETPAVRSEFAAAFSEVELRFAQAPTAEEIRAAAGESNKPAVLKQMDRAWAKAMNAELAHGGIRLAYPYPVQAWRLGGLTWVALGGEVVVDYALRLKHEVATGGRTTWVFGYSNDVMCYIPSESVLAEGGYEGKTSMVPYGRPSPWAPGLEEKIVARARALVREVRGEPVVPPP